MNVHVVVAIPNASVVDNTRLATNVLFTVIIMTTEVSPFIRQCITDYVEALIQKLQKRAAKHPEDNFLSLDKESLAEYNTQSLENHLIEEFGEFIATMDNPPLFLKDFAIRVLGPGDHAKHSVDFESKKTELRDLGNMCLILYSAYSARSEPRCKGCGMVGSREEVLIHSRLGYDAL